MKQTFATGRVAADLHVDHARLHRVLAGQITELADGGLSPHEIAAHLAMPLALVNLTLRGGTFEVTK